jgi:transcriptional regulator with XRE-family HTH domain
MRQFHEIINERRRLKGWTVDHVTDLLEQHLLARGRKPPARATVGHWFNGTRSRPRSMEQLRGLCEVLDIELGEAMGGAPLEAKTALEQVILAKSRPLSEADQELVIAFLDRLHRT